jgi:hypothetical protein
MKTIIEMAREAGMAGFDGVVHAAFQLEAFAALVRADATSGYAKKIEELIQERDALRALTQPEERNFCPRCGKRTADLTTIHTCTPPVAADPKAFHGFPHGSVSTPKAGGKCLTAGETAP